MVNFKTEKVSSRVTRIFAINTELMYLVEGDKRAALLDTGSGFGSLRAVVEKLTDKPVIVLLTHGHTDHAMGAAEFPVVYMNHEDDYIYVPHGEEQFRKEGMKMSPEYELMEEKDYIPTAPVTAFHDMKGGDSFDLGGVTIDIYDCAGHTRGSVAMLIREERMLLTGDACSGATFIFEDYSLTVREYEKNLQKFKQETDGKYDRVLASHGDGNAPCDIVDGVLAVCEDIRMGRTDDVPFDFKDAKGLIAKKMQFPEMIRVDGGHGNIIYDKNRV